MTEARNLPFENLFTRLKLGAVAKKPTPCSGGLLHRMYRVETGLAVYAVKVLNPQIMLRPSAMSNMVSGEQIAAHAARFIPAVSALLFEGNPVCEMGGQFYLVYPWIVGESISPQSVTPHQSEIMGNLLADLHQTDFSPLNINRKIVCNKSAINWEYYLGKGRELSSEWVGLVEHHWSHLIRYQEETIRSASVYSGTTVISHRDLDPKNTLWTDFDHPVVIDWESAGPVSPAIDLMDTALYWSADQEDTYDQARFTAFLKAYLKTCPQTDVPWRAALQRVVAGKLNWLEYSMKCSLGIESMNPGEQDAGTWQVFGTLRSLFRFEEQMDDILNWIAAL